MTLTNISRTPPNSTLFPYTTLFRSHGRRLSRLPPQGADRRRRLHHGPLRRGVPVRRRRALPRHHLLRRSAGGCARQAERSEEHTSELQSRENLVCRLLLEKKKKNTL